MDGLIFGTHAKAMTTLGEEVKLAGDVMLFVFEVKHG
jgi:hypothetical protein